MCQIALTSITGQSTNGINAGSIIISGTASPECGKLRLRIIGCNFNPHDAVVDVTGGNWSYQLAGDCLCNAMVSVHADCLDENENPVNCPPFDFQAPIVCSPPSCCVEAQIIPTIGDCNANNERQVTFNVTVVLAPSQTNCLPFIVQLDFGDGNSSGAQVITTTGTHSFSLTHNYNANASYTAHLVYVLPGGANCPAVNAALTIPPCTADCCPEIRDVTVNFGRCTDNCEREVILTTNFANPVGSCPPAFLEWEITGANNFSTTGTGFTSAAVSPHTETFLLNPANAPFTAKLVVHYPLGCVEVVKTFTVPECTSPAPCPQINNLSYDVGKCVEQGERCCREIAINYDITALLGCGNTPKPKIRFNFGDGTTHDMQFTAAGNHQGTLTKRYCSGGDYIVTLETLSPAACFDETLNISVPGCDPQECGQSSTEEEAEEDGGKFCPCCIPLLILITSYFCLWTLGYYTGSLTIYTINLGLIGGYASFLFLLLSWVIINFCYRIVKDCRKCWQCRVYRCTFIALIISIIMIIVMVIIAYYYGNMAAVPQWIPAILSAISGALVTYALMQAEPCKTFYKTGKCK